MLPSILKELPMLKISSPSNSFSFQKGKIFFGTIKNLFPNDTALVQIGEQKLIAKLEIGLMNGESYWFQVGSVEGDIKLKLLSRQPVKEQDFSKLLKDLSLPSTKNNIELMRFLSKEHIPLSKDTLTKISQWIENIPDAKQHLNIIKLMIEKELPLTETVFKSLLKAENPDKIQSQLQLLDDQLINQKQSPTVEAIRSMIHTIRRQYIEKNSLEMIQSLLKAATSQDEEKQLLSGSILQKLGWKEEVQLNGEQAEHNPTIGIALNDKNKQEMFISQKVKDVTGQLIENQFVQKTTNEVINLSKSEKDFLNEIMDTMKQSFTRHEVLQQFKEVIKSLGLFYEGQLANNPEKDDSEALKPLLIKYLQESAPTSTAHDLAQNIVLKMNGQQLQSYDNGPFHQLFLEIPVQLFGFETNVAMQWTGKKNEEGKFDANYCHILFYLDLEYLRQTVVEMKIQNRVITVNVFNELSFLKDTSSSLISALREGLKELNYHLSEVHFIEKKSQSSSEMLTAKKVINQSYKGVDIRI